MIGAHRRTTQSRVTSARKSAFWLAALAGVLLIPVVFLAVLALSVYFVIGRNTYTLPAWALPAGVALIGAGWLWLLGDLARLLRKRPRLPEVLLAVIVNAWWLMGITMTLLIAVGQLVGWKDGSFELALEWTYCLFPAGYSAYLLWGKRRLLAILRARAPGMERPA